MQQVEKELQEREWALSAMTKIRDSLEDQLQTLE